jgi:hypothetical protein
MYVYKKSSARPFIWWSLTCYIVGHICVIGWITFGSEKKSSKHINMGFSFEDLLDTSPIVKTDPKSDSRFKLVQNNLNFQILHLMLLPFNHHSISLDVQIFARVVRDMTMGCYFGHAWGDNLASTRYRYDSTFKNAAPITAARNC